jgi:hypothetical protein
MAAIQRRLVAFAHILYFTHQSFLYDNVNVMMMSWLLAAMLLACNIMSSLLFMDDRSKTAQLSAANKNAFLKKQDRSTLGC